MTTLQKVEEWRAAGLHERTGYPLLEVSEAEQVVRVLARQPQVPTCASCWWCKDGRWGAPTASGDDTTWFDARCERRYVELLDGENERDPDCPDGFGPGYKRDHRPDATCGAGTVEERHWGNLSQREFVERVPADRAAHDLWWHRNYPRLGVGNQKPDHPGCIHWRAREPELAKIRARGRGADIADIWAELDGAA